MIQWHNETISVGLLIAAELEFEEEPGFDFGGSLWVYDAAAPEGASNWKLFLNRWAVDPEAAPCLDPVRVDDLRIQAQSLVNAFPATIPHLQRLGCNHAREALLQPIACPADVENWAYSIWNAAVPTIDDSDRQYPRRVASTQALLDRDDFTVVQPDVQGHVAVLPAPDRKTEVYWATPGTVYAGKVGERLGPRHPVSLKAYKSSGKDSHQ